MRSFDGTLDAAYCCAKAQPLSFYPFVLHEISVLVELILGHLRSAILDCICLVYRCCHRKAAWDHPCCAVVQGSGNNSNEIALPWKGLSTSAGLYLKPPPTSTTTHCHLVSELHPWWWSFHRRTWLPIVLSYIQLDCYHTHSFRCGAIVIAYVSIRRRYQLMIDY